MYKIMAGISFFIRNFCLPNPFENLKYGVIINLMIEPLLHIIIFGIVGLFYEKSSAPAWGSFLYLFFYAAHTCLIMICSIFNFDKITIIVITILYIAILITLIALKNKLFTRYY